MKKLDIVKIAAAILAAVSAFAAHAGDRPLLRGGFGNTGAPTETKPSAAVLANSASGAVTISNGPAVPAAASAAPAAPCVVKDPEDGACYASADAADVAWLGRGPLLVSADIAVPLEDPTELADADLDEGLEATREEAADAEDGGVNAPVDAGHQLADAPAEESKPSLWQRFTQRITGLVVRKSDSRPVSIPEEELASFLSGDFPLPIQDYPKDQIADSFNAPRGKHRRHHAIDLPADRGTPVIAVVNGSVERIGRDRFGGKVVYLRDRTGRFTFYYAHLSRFAKGLRNGDPVRKGETLGYVGATGRASGPHLHFAIFRDAEQKQEAVARAFVVNPYLIFAGITGRR